MLVFFCAKFCLTPYSHQNQVGDILFCQVGWTYNNNLWLCLLFPYVLLFSKKLICYMFLWAPLLWFVSCHSKNDVLKYCFMLQPSVGVFVLFSHINPTWSFYLSFNYLPSTKPSPQLLLFWFILFIISDLDRILKFWVLFYKKMSHLSREKLYIPSPIFSLHHWLSIK